MRITNGMMVNSTLANISTNKKQMNTLDTQLATQKKISRPSEDPVIAIRALRLRTSLSQVTQYLTKNIPDANSWMDVTEGALTTINDIISDLYEKCNQGSSDTLATEQRSIIKDSLTTLSDALYAQGNADYAGRYVFTGYKTNSSLTFTSAADADEYSYKITEEFTAESFSTKTVLTNQLDIEAVKSAMSAADISLGNTSENATVNRIRLSYNELKDGSIPVIKYTDQNGNQQQYTAYAITETTDTSIVPGDDEILYNPDTGELMFGKNAYNDIRTLDGFTVDYEKENFENGDCKPEHYFSCTRINKATGEMMQFTKAKEGQDIMYTVNFNAELKVNTEASDAISLGIGRDVTELVNSINLVEDCENKVAELEKLKENENYASDEWQAKLDSLLEEANKELDYAKDTMQKAFESGITKMQGHQQTVAIANSDIGNRMSRLELTKTRLESQQTNFTKLKSENEDIDLEEVVVNYSSVELVYNAALTAASKVVRQTLLDFI